jgi:hypothetical protein
MLGLFPLASYKPSSSGEVSPYFKLLAMYDPTSYSLGTERGKSG